MVITDKNKLKNYSADKRLWQGIPGIEVTKNGRVFMCFYSGGVKEQTSNYVAILKSDDGKDFGDPIYITYKENGRSFDPCLWIDPLGRLWLFWAVSPDHAVYGTYCENPDADDLKWCEPFVVGHDVMMNKPIVLTTGEWMLPICVWIKDYCIEHISETEGVGSYAYRSIDNGKSFDKLGCSDVKDRVFDEHMIVELADGRLAMYVRTRYGIGVSYSYDRGKTWTEGVDSGLGGPNSRFFISKLKSGRILLVNHYGYEYNDSNINGRSHLTAMLSEDDGKTWPYKLLLDERNNVSYPDGVEAADGYIYVAYDRERGSFCKNLESVYSQARELLYAKITEEDIIAGKIVDKKSKLKVVASKLDKYIYEDENPYNEFERFTAEQLADELLDKKGSEVMLALFDHYNINCMNMHRIDSEKLDKLIGDFDVAKTDKKKKLTKIISLIRSVSPDTENIPVIDLVKKVVAETLNENISVKDIAEKVGISYYYMCHFFKKTTGVTVVDYRNELKISKAKQLLVNSEMTLAEIAQNCGFGSSSYFTKIFTRAEKISPSDYRKNLK